MKISSIEQLGFKRYKGLTTDGDWLLKNEELNLFILYNEQTKILGITKDTSFKINDTMTFSRIYCRSSKQLKDIIQIVLFLK